MQSHLILRGSLLASLFVAGCGGNSAPYTLYRNSNLDANTRIHWATFDAGESSAAYNMNNCLMAAKLLNANMDAATQRAGSRRPPRMGFWCEPGRYTESGRVPMNFPAEYPTDSF